MRSEKVDEYLSLYKNNLARCRFLECSISEAERILKDAESLLVEESISITQKLSDMPHGSDVGDPTGLLGLKLAEGHLPDYILEIEEDIKRMREEIQQKIIVVHFVEAWLEVLSAKERFVIENQLIGGIYWREVIHLYRAKFGASYSKDTLKRLRDMALEKIYDIAK